VSSKSNQFVSLAWVVLLAACHSAPVAPTRASTHAAVAGKSGAAPTSGSAASVPAAAPSGGTPGPSGAAVPNRAAGPGGPVSAEPAPIPPRAAQQYDQALQLMKSGRDTDAELEFKQLTAAYPQFAGPHLNLGLLYMRSSRLKEAEGEFKAAVELGPNNAVAGNELGIAQRKLGKFADAEATYQRTIAAEPAYAPTYLNLGMLYDLYLGEPQKALDEFEHYIQIAGENKQVNGWVVELRKRVGAPAPAAKKEPA